MSVTTAYSSIAVTVLAELRSPRVPHSCVVKGQFFWTPLPCNVLVVTCHLQDLVVMMVIVMHPVRLLSALFPLLDNVLYSLRLTKRDTIKLAWPPARVSHMRCKDIRLFGADVVRK